ncbi:hypothetical protein K439DRAFT_810334 [Ramaria rubella]|nr:hypothetical protein K439DRAFT_810334 [Ramaria rubella]
MKSVHRSLRKNSYGISAPVLYAPRGDSRRHAMPSIVSLAERPCCHKAKQNLNSVISVRRHVFGRQTNSYLRLFNNSSPLSLRHASQPPPIFSSALSTRRIIVCIRIKFCSDTLCLFPAIIILLLVINAFTHSGYVFPRTG